MTYTRITPQAPGQRPTTGTSTAPRGLRLLTLDTHHFLTGVRTRGDLLGRFTSRMRGGRREGFATLREVEIYHEAGRRSLLVGVTFQIDPDLGGDHHPTHAEDPDALVQLSRRLLASLRGTRDRVFVTALDEASIGSIEFDGVIDITI